MYIDIVKYILYTDYSVLWILFFLYLSKYFHLFYCILNGIQSERQSKNLTVQGLKLGFNCAYNNKCFNLN